MTETYQLYIFPNCEKCHEVKDILKSKGIAYNEINLASNDGRKEFGKIYGKIDARLKRDERKMSILPIFIKFKEEGLEKTIEEISQGEDIRAFLSSL